MEAFAILLAAGVIAVISFTLKQNRKNQFAVLGLKNAALNGMKRNDQSKK